MHGNGPSVLYPAVHELFLIGSSAEPFLLNFIAENRDNDDMAKQNALYTLLLIRHGNVISLIRELRTRSKSSITPIARERLEAAAKEAMKWCDGQSKTKCEDVLVE